jgi:hypothetical protein
MVAVVVDFTPVVETVNVPVVAPAAIVAVAGTVAFELLEDRLTVVPPGGAGAFKVIVPVEDLPPWTELGESVRLAKPDGLIVRVAVFVALPSPAVIVVVTVEVTPVVLTVNAPVVAPAATVTDAGKVALELPDVSVTTMPPAGAAPVRVTVPVDGDPPVTAVGASTTLDSCGAVIVRVAVFATAPRVAVIVALVVVETAVVLIVNVAVVLLAATVTVAGTVALVEFDFRLTTIPPVGAAPLS